MFEQVVQGSWVISILGDFQIVGQVLEPPNLLLSWRFDYGSRKALVKPELFYFVVLGEEDIKEESSNKNMKSIFVIIQRCLYSYWCFRRFSLYLLLRRRDKPSFSDSSWKQCEERLTEFADTYIKHQLNISWSFLSPCHHFHSGDLAFPVLH